MNKRELLARFLNNEIDREELRKELSKGVPLIFQLIDDVPMKGDIPSDAKGVYQDQEGNDHTATYGWFQKESENRDVAICLISTTPNLIQSI